MKKIFVLGALVLGIGILSFSAPVDAQEKAQRSKIAVFNIAKVLRKYNKANQEGKTIADKRKGYLDQINTIRNQINDLNKQMTGAAANKDTIQEQIIQKTQEIEKLDRLASKQLTEMSNETIKRVYQEISGLVKEVAEVNGFEMILAYPDATDPKERETPMLAQLMLQTPALMPFYVNPSLDITDYVIKNLNSRYPAPPVDEKDLQPVTGGGAPMGGGGVPKN